MYCLSPASCLSRSLAIVLVSIAMTATPASAREADVARAYDALLGDAVRSGRVDYDRFREAAVFRDYLDMIAATDPASFQADEQALAFYINAYNALVLQSVVEGRSPDSLLGRLKFFKLAKHRIAGETLSLVDIEQDKILARGDARAVFALTQAAVSSPPLLSGLYRGNTLDQQLDDQATRFVNDPDFNTFDDAGRAAEVSKIFKWHRESIESGEQSIAGFLAFYMRDSATAAALREGDYVLKFRSFDWSLNGSVSPASSN